jgi:hypothetical protein
MSHRNYKDIRTATAVLAESQLKFRIGLARQRTQSYPLDSFAAQVNVAKAGTWIFNLGHDGGAILFVDGKPAYCEPETANPAKPGRTHVPVKLDKGVHDIVVAFDLDEARGWGIFLNFTVPEADRTAGGPTFPVPVPRPPRMIGKRCEPNDGGIKNGRTGQHRSAHDIRRGSDFRGPNTELNNEQ